MSGRQFSELFRRFDWWFLPGYLLVFVGVWFPLFSIRYLASDSGAMLFELILGLLLLSPLHYRVMTLVSLAAVISILNRWPCLPYRTLWAVFLNTVFRLWGVLSFFLLPNSRLTIAGWLIVTGLSWLLIVRFFDEWGQTKLATSSPLAAD